MSVCKRISFEKDEKNGEAKNDPKMKQVYVPTWDNTESLEDVNPKTIPTPAIHTFDRDETIKNALQ